MRAPRAPNTTPQSARSESLRRVPRGGGTQAKTHVTCRTDTAGAGVRHEQEGSFRPRRWERKETMHTRVHSTPWAPDTALALAVSSGQSAFAATFAARRALGCSARRRAGTHAMSVPATAVPGDGRGRVFPVAMPFVTAPSCMWWRGLLYRATPRPARVRCARPERAGAAPSFELNGNQSGGGGESSAREIIRALRPAVRSRQVPWPRPARGRCRGP